MKVTAILFSLFVATALSSPLHMLKRDDTSAGSTTSSNSLATDLNLVQGNSDLFNGDDSAGGILDFLKSLFGGTLGSGDDSGDDSSSGTSGSSNSSGTSGASTGSTSLNLGLGATNSNSDTSADNSSGDVLTNIIDSLESSGDSGSNPVSSILESLES